MMPVRRFFTEYRSGNGDTGKEDDQILYQVLPFRAGNKREMDKTDIRMEKNASMVPGIRMNWSKIENRSKGR